MVEFYKWIRARMLPVDMSTTKEGDGKAMARQFERILMVH